MDPFQVPQQPICTPSGKPVRGTGTTTSVWIQDWDSYWTIMQKQSPGSASFKSKLYFSLSQFPSSKVASEQRSSNNGDHEHSAHFITRDCEAFACRIIWQKVQRVPALPKVGWQGRQSMSVCWQPSPSPTHQHKSSAKNSVASCPCNKKVEKMYNFT